MVVYTCQLKHIDKAIRLNLEFIDTTVMTGNIAFAPTWSMVKGIKHGTMSEEEYTKRYTELMRISYIEHRKTWDKLLSEDTVVLACYCKAGDFCHRLLLLDIIEVICEFLGISFDYEGELRDELL